MNILLEILCVAAGGGIGAYMRSVFSAKFDTAPLVFPWGTFAANMLSSFLLGAIVSLAALHDINKFFYLFIDTGFCAALSTFSSLTWQMVEMIRRKLYLNATVYTLSTFICGIALFEASYILTNSIFF